MELRSLLALAWRESRFARGRLFLFLSAISLGVAALVATQSFGSGMARAVREQARALLGADASLRSGQPFGEATEALLDSLRKEGVGISRTTSFMSMARVPRTGDTRLVQVRAVEGAFPFYGEIETTPAGVWEALPANRNALVDPALLLGLGARVGDTLALGTGRFRILGVLEEVPGDVNISAAFAPRVYIPERFLDETGLIRFGSMVEHEAFLRLPSPAAARELEATHGAALREERVGIRTAQEQQEAISDVLGRLADYLGLIGVFALLLGGIGVASAMGAYMRQKAETIAIFRCLGATAKQMFGIYIVQALAMGFAGATAGVVLGLAVQWVLPMLLADFLPVRVAPMFNARAVLAGLVVGVWVALVFALLPLLDARRVSPLLALRRRVEAVQLAGTDPWRWAAWAVLGGSVALLLVLQVGELAAGLGFAAGIAAALAGLWLAARLVIRVVSWLRSTGLPYPVRQGLANLYRPGNQTRVVVLALGFGVFLLSTLFLTQHNLLRPLSSGGEGVRANLVLWDVQDDQHAPIEALLRERGHPILQHAPIVPMRIVAINGTEVELGERRSGEGEPEGWALRHEYRSTYRDTLVASERIRAGSWWEGGERQWSPGEPAPVSLETGVAEDLGVGIGDHITWDVQGVRIPTRIVSLREVDWARFEPNFFAVFPTATLVGAPQTWVLLTHASTAASRARVQRTVVERFPNVSVLDLTRIQAMVDATVGRVSLVVRFLAGFSIATGLVVLLGAVSASRLERVRDSILLRTLGATRRQIRSILLAEYMLLGMMAALAGILLSVGAGWALAHWRFEMEFAIPGFALAALGAIVSLLAMAVGLWASRESYRDTPFEALRAE